MKRVWMTIGFFLIFSGCISQHISIGTPEITSSGEASERISAYVTEVIDGDTIVLQTGEKVRLLGIDAPESGKSYYEEAKNRLRELIENRTIALERDATDKDKYDRLLRFVFYNNENICVRMVREGLAKTYIVLPSVKYRNELEQAEIEAKNLGVGMWGVATIQTPSTYAPPTYPPSTQSFLSTPYPPACLMDYQGNLPVISWNCADQYYNQEVIVEGKIVATNNTGKVCFLNFDLNWKIYFTAVIFASDFSRFPPNPEKFYLNKKVRVRGIVKPYEGKPEIILENPSQIWVIG